MIRRISALIVAIVLTAGTLMAEPFVSLNGKFHINVPSDWYRVDYQTVDFYLSRGTGRRVPKYEAALAPKGSNPWNAGAYMMLTFEPLPNPTAHQIDSILASLSASVEKPVNKNAAGPTYNGLWQPNEVSYWPGRQIAAVSMEPTATGDKVRTQIVLKFFDNGIANFYCYSPDSMWNVTQSVFTEVVTSFSTENLDSMLPKETLKVAEPAPVEQKTESNRSWIPIYSGVGVVIIIAVAAARRRRRSRKPKTTQQ